MKSVIDGLLTLQGLHFKTLKGSPSRADQMKQLRGEIPESYLLMFDRLVARNKKAVSTVRHGVCSECHIQVAVGVLADLTFGHGLHQCGNCGRFLYLPEDETVLPKEQPAKANQAKTSKAALAH